MMQATDPATLPLRDIHLPDPVSWWPPAPGWWLLLLFIIIVISLSIFFIKKRKAQRYSAIFLAQKEMDRVKTDFNHHQDKKMLARELSELLRRISISVFSRHDTASLTSEAWLAFLDEQIDKNLFSQGTGRVLIEAPYKDNVDYDSGKLIALVESWIDTVAKQKKGRTK